MGPVKRDLHVQERARRRDVRASSSCFSFLLESRHQGDKAHLLMYRTVIFFQGLPRSALCCRVLECRFNENVPVWRVAHFGLQHMISPLSRSFQELLPVQYSFISNHGAPRALQLCLHVQRSSLFFFFAHLSSRCADFVLVMVTLQPRSDVVVTSHDMAQRPCPAGFPPT